MIQRRTLLKSGAAAAALGAPGLSALAQQTVTLKFHTFMAPQSNVWINMHKAWMSKVEAESGGRIKFEAYPAMQLGGTPVQLYDQAKDGVVDIVWTLPGNTAGRFPRIEVFELPFMMSNAEATSKAYWEYVQTMAPDEFKDVQVIALHVHGPGVIHTTEKPVKTTGDMKGLKMRAPTRQVTKLMGILGATPVGMPLPGIPDALSKGTINGCVIPWEVVPSVKVQELTKYHAEFDPAGGALYTTTFVMAMNKAKYNSLPPDLKKVIDNNSGLATSAWLGKVQQAGDAAGRQAAVGHGNVIFTVGPAEAQEFRRKARPIEAEWVEDMNKRGFDGRKLLDTARALIEKNTKTTKS
ncbi:MAG: TRAP transporter substrate-binding protein [Comamonadaceae bacterium]|jgi:TRAP-type C4-dicarboxylate transport system substrate-binding protein|uniref:TRAP transporter substrate-binding protein n=1 Tax=Candidatus Skiveiella danica TaxID=3386177 RepID=UPI0009D2C004|nr:TRAP transporter substrate-binding protein [Comamonadaceae bacterium]MBK9985457.1 TRAP transporter substrate-binding protein [Betaproteobacteria bacterium]MBP6308812.1 TRAP transporter substrate-binding protein [Burkholderiaceae bacterium]OQC04776.1 MAG: Sialic acid-binding periplasmic protein SiaP precursor [Alphaproteobacteria bacterium ADurb.Bin100]MBK7118771.1 TRAP transporter substrate-binding protein [Comamonadaceae bacterium]